MRIRWALVAASFLSSCERPFDYSTFARSASPRLERICRLDVRLRSLLGDPAPDPTRLRSILDSMAAGLPASRSSRTDSQAVATTARIISSSRISPSLHPSDSDLVPSLAWARKRAGCVPLALFWTELLRRQGIAAGPFLLPGHLAVKLPDGSRLEPLRGGIPRDSGFYDSAFSLSKRPYYASLRMDTNAILASMLVQTGLLEWKSGQLASAESAFQAASKLCPGLPEAEGNLGLVLVAEDRPELAIPRLNLALAGDASNLRASRVRDSLVLPSRIRLSP